MREYSGFLYIRCRRITASFLLEKLFSGTAKLIGSFIMSSHCGSAGVHSSQVISRWKKNMLSASSWDWWSSFPFSLSYLIFLNTTSSSLRCEPWELTAILLHHRRDILETGDCGLLDECQTRLAIHCSWRCSTMQRHTPNWSYPLVLTLDELPTNANAQKLDPISDLVHLDQIKVGFYQCPMALAFATFWRMFICFPSSFS